VFAVERRDDGVERQVPAIAKQPEVRFTPVAKVEVAVVILVVAVPFATDMSEVLALPRVVRPATERVEPRVMAPVTVKAPTLVDDACEIDPPVRVASPVTPRVEESVAAPVVVRVPPIPTLPVMVLLPTIVLDAFAMNPLVSVWSELHVLAVVVPYATERLLAAKRSG
jgi:hypothetical protein